MDSGHKKNIIIGTIWTLIGQFGYLSVALISNIILARILTPYEFGQIGIVMFFIIMSKVFTESGLSGAIIRKKDADAVDYSTVFIFNLILSVVLVVILFFAAGPIADFYNDIELKDIIRYSSVVLLIYAFQITHITKLVQQLEFRRKATYEFIAILISSITAILLAYKGFGVWAMVTMQILTALILTILLWLFEKRPTVFMFSLSSFRNLYRFGMNTTISSLLNTVFDNIYQLILGKYFAINQTGLFYQAKKIQEIPVQVIGSLAHGVIFSSLAKVQDSKKQFTFLFDRITTSFAALLGLLTLLVVLYAENIIVMLYGQQWLASAFYLQVLIIAAFFYVHEVLNQIIFKTFDQTQKILYLEIVKKIIQSVSITLGIIFLNLEILLYGFLVTNVISYLANAYYSRKELNESIGSEITLTLKIVISCLITAATIFTCISFFDLEGFRTFYLIPFAVLIYFILLKILRAFDVIKDVRIILKNSFSN